MRGVRLAGFLLIVGVIVSSGLVQAATTGKKAVMIIAHEGFQDDEFFIPKEALEKSGIEVDVASTELTDAIGMNGGHFQPDILLKDLNVMHYDAVIFIGGTGARQYIDDPLASRIARDAASTNRVVGAICVAPMILAKAGVLTGKNSTVYPSEGKNLAACSVNYTAKPVEKDGNIITADGPGSAVEFGEMLSREILSR